MSWDNLEDDEDLTPIPVVKLLVWCTVSVATVILFLLWVTS